MPGRTLSLLLDLGGTVFRSGSELLGLLGEAEPAARAVVARRGPLGPEYDDLWERMQRGQISEREYWAIRCREVGAALRRDWTVPEFMNTLHGLVEDVVLPEAARLIRDARAAGVQVGVLTNDLRAFHGSDASTVAHPILSEVDVIVDGSVTGFLKPDPRAYAVAIERLGRAPGDILFLDDMPWNVEGARRAGMIALQVDLADQAAALAAARERLDLAA